MGYPYEMAKSYCRYSANNLGASISGAKRVSFGSESDLKRAVSMVPTSVAIDASHYSFQLYSGGVYDEPYCSSYSLDHGVLAVGYVARAARTTGSSRTPGEPSGVRLVTSRCPGERTTSAVSPPWPATPRPNLSQPVDARCYSFYYFLIGYLENIPHTFVDG